MDSMYGPRTFGPGPDVWDPMYQTKDLTYGIVHRFQPVPPPGPPDSSNTPIMMYGRDVRTHNLDPMYGYDVDKILKISLSPFCHVPHTYNIHFFFPLIINIHYYIFDRIYTNNINAEYKAKQKNTALKRGKKKKRIRKKRMKDLSLNHIASRVKMNISPM